MPGDNRLKIIQVVCILVLVIGLISTIRDELTSLPAGSPGAISAQENQSVFEHAIDSAFFNFNQSSPTASPAVPKSVSKPTQSVLSQLAPQTLPTVSLAVTIKPASSLSSLITADSYLVGNLATGEIYLEKDPTVVRPIASISKLFAALVATRHLDPAATVTVLPQSITGFDATNSPSTIHPGESFSIHDILYDMLLVSSNDAATTIADNYARITGTLPADASRADFVSLMNAAVASLGLSSTSFKDPSGLSAGNVSSADDLFYLAQYLYKNQPGILAITKTPEYDVATTTSPDAVHDAHQFVNIDPFVYDPHYFGGKTGRTDAAGETMLSLFNLPTGVSTDPIAIIVLHSNQDTRQIDSAILVSKAMALISTQ
jgi:D-alanyl-D-alanine carboxypeptidase